MGARSRGIGRVSVRGRVKARCSSRAASCMSTAPRRPPPRLRSIAQRRALHRVAAAPCGTGTVAGTGDGTGAGRSALTARCGDRPCPSKDASLPCCHALPCDALPCNAPRWRCSSSGADKSGAEACAETACAEAAFAEAACAAAAFAEAACALSMRARSVGQPCWSAGGRYTPSIARSSPG